MKVYIQDINDITDSREMLEAKPHKFTSILIYTLLLVIISVLVWSYFGEVDIVVKASGVVRPNAKVGLIKNKTLGKVKNINFYGGQNVKKGNILYTMEDTVLVMEKNNLIKDIEKLKTEESNLITLRKSITEDVNYFDDNSELQKEYYYKFLKYEIDYEKLQLEEKQAALKLNNKENPEIISLNKRYVENNIKKHKIDNLVQIDESLKEIEIKIQEFERKLKAVELNLEECIVRAPIDGTVNILKEISKEELLQTGMEIVSIVPNDNLKYNIQLFLNNKDVANIKEGNKIKYHFNALPYKEYGELVGTINKISVDSKTDPISGKSYYILESSIENKPLYSYKGVKSEIKVGMTCEAQIITERKKILYYFLEKINLKD